jgi:hypothetical protein
MNNTWEAVNDFIQYKLVMGELDEESGGKNKDEEKQ